MTWAVQVDQREITHIASYVTQLQRNRVHSKTLKLQKCNNWLSNYTCFNISVSTFTNTNSDRARSSVGIISLGGDAVLRHAYDIVRRLKIVHVTQCHNEKVIIIKFFKCIGSGQQYVHRQETIDTTTRLRSSHSRQLKE